MVSVRGGANPNVNVNRVNNLLKEIGRSIDPTSEDGMRVSNKEAEKIVGELDKLPQAERAGVVSDLQMLMQHDFFSVTKSARSLFASKMGVEEKSLLPREKAELVGLAEEKSQFQMTVQRLAKPVSMNKAEMDNLIDKTQQFMPPEMQGLIAVSLQNAQSDGLLKLEGPARRSFVKFYGQQDVQAASKDWNTFVDSKGAGNVDYLSSIMMSGMCFEDMVAAFLSHFVSKQQEAQKEKMRELQDNDDLQRTSDRLKQLQQKAMQQGGQVELTDADKNQLGVLNKYGVGVQQDVPADAKPGGADKPAEPTKPEVPTEPNKPAVDTDAKVEEVKEKLTTLVSNVHKHLADTEKDGSTGIINRQEAVSIKKDLEALPDGVDKLVAQGLANTLRHTEGMADKLADPKSALAPLADFIKSKLGDDVDLSPDPAYKPGSGLNSDIAKKLFYDGDKKKPRLENKLAAFLIDSLLVSEKNLDSKKQDLTRFTKELTKTPEARAAFAEMVGGPPATDYSPKEALKAREGHPTAEVPQDTTVVGAKVGESLENNVKFALEDAEKSGKPVSLFINNEDVTVKPGDKLEDVVKDVEARTGMKGDEVAKDFPSVMSAEQIQQKLAQLPDPKSRELMFEDLKNMNNLLSQMMQALGNILNSMHQNAMNSIRAIR
jgi:hypothetical protein